MEKVRFKLPVAALRLNEDIQTLGRILQDLETIDPASISDKEQGELILRMMRTMGKACERYATIKLRKDYLRRF